MEFYNAVINFSGKRQELTSDISGTLKLSNEYIVKIAMEAADYDEETGQPSEGNIVFHLLNGKGETIDMFIPEKASATEDGGISVSLENSQ